MTDPTKRQLLKRTNAASTSKPRNNGITLTTTQWIIIFMIVFDVAYFLGQHHHHHHATNTSTSVSDLQNLLSPLMAKAYFTNPKPKHEGGMTFLVDNQYYIQNYKNASELMQFLNNDNSQSTRKESSSVPSSTSSSEEILLEALDELLQDENSGVWYPPETFEQRQEFCAKHHGWKPFVDQTTNEPRQRRLFAGGLIADDSNHVIIPHIYESYGLLHSVTLVESNRTTNLEPRKFVHYRNESSLLNKPGIYGPNTIVTIVPDIQEQKSNIHPLGRENLMRALVLQQWKLLGMSRDDVGIMMDMDECTSRDLLQAFLICQPPDWDLNEINGTDNDCRVPMVRITSVFFEGTPKCIHMGQKNEQMMRRWTNPPIVLGACIQGIGNTDTHFNPPRRNEVHRKDGYGERNDWKEYNKENTTLFFPLFNAADFRHMKNGMYYWQGGFHFHNFFNHADSIRRKHATYGHKHDGALTDPLNAINADLNVLVKCVMGRNDTNNRKRYLQEPFALETLIQTPSLQIPQIYHKVPQYMTQRHLEVYKLIESDEHYYGRADNFDGQHLYNTETMLTHPGQIHQDQEAIINEQ